MISIAMATYNGEKYITEQIDSILKQTYQDFELIICDDCSNDSTWNILKKYEEKDNRIHCHQNSKNLGLNRNFEKAISLCIGEYIALSDQDDIWTSDHLELLLQNIGNNLICCGDSLLVNEDGKELYKCSDMYENLSLIDTPLKKLLRILYVGNFYGGATMLIKNDFLKAILPIPNSNNSYDIWFVLCACMQNSFIYIDNIVRYFRQHSLNASGSKKKRTLKDSLINFSLIKNQTFERIIYCHELLERYPNINQDIRSIILSAEDYYKHKSSRLYRIKHLHFWIENFPYLYLTKSRKIFFFRLVKYVCF
jgi:glycosyltransferase involved in cell wall biosynthesis